MKKIIAAITVMVMLFTSVPNVWASSEVGKVSRVSAKKTKHSITLRWKKAPNATKYIIYVKNRKLKSVQNTRKYSDGHTKTNSGTTANYYTGKFKKVKTTKNTKATIKKLKKGTTYKIRITAKGETKGGSVTFLIKTKGKQKPLDPKKYTIKELGCVNYSGMGFEVWPKEPLLPKGPVSYLEVYVKLIGKWKKYRRFGKAADTHLIATIPEDGTYPDKGKYLIKARYALGDRKGPFSKPIKNVLTTNSYYDRTDDAER